MVIKLLFSNYAKEIDANVRIMGIKQIEKGERRDSRFSWVRIALEIAMVGFLLVGMIDFLGFNGPVIQSGQSTPVWMAGVVITLSIMLVIVLVDRLKRD